jgi:ABC-type Fe3+/spermidine/putrescine transport system ATPase subunit
LLNLKEHNIQNKTKRLIKDLSKRSLVVKPAQKIAILNNPQSNLTFENLKYLQKALQRSSNQFDIFTFKAKTDHYNELRGIVADKTVFSSFGKIKSPEIKDFLSKDYDLLLDFTKMSNLYEKYLSLAIKSNFRVGYKHPEALYDLMIEVPAGDMHQCN